MGSRNSGRRKSDPTRMEYLISEELGGNATSYTDLSKFWQEFSKDLLATPEGRMKWIRKVAALKAVPHKLVAINRKRTEGPVMILVQARREGMFATISFGQKEGVFQLVERAPGLYTIQIEPAGPTTIVLGSCGHQVLRRDGSSREINNIPLDSCIIADETVTNRTHIECQIDEWVAPRKWSSNAAAKRVEEINAGL